ncbi:non-ribosomal peptide synthetase [Actinoplanes sp. NBRC 14428]|nr:non-ribosomal peptide synthetase [Actinoplanes sp. NBRC 14428]
MSETSTVQRLRAVWAEALDAPADFPDEASFFELGGYSLLALAVADRIGAELRVEAPRMLIFEHPTFRDLAGWAAAQEPGPAPGQQDAAPQTTSGEPATFPMSPLQQAYVLGETGSFPFSSPAQFVEEYRCPELDVEAFGTAVLRLVDRHEMLRAVYTDVGEGRVAAPPERAPVEVRDLRHLDAGDAVEVITGSREELARTPPPLGSAEIVRFRLFRRTDHWHVQVAGRLLTFDGRSGDVFADELRDLLDGRPLPPLRYGYPRYRRAVADESHEDDRRYWVDRLPSLPAAPELPYRPEVVSGSLRRRTVTVEGDAWRAFKAGAARHGITTTVALCAAFGEVLRHFSAAPDFTLNVMYGERRPLHDDVPAVIGNFSDTLLLACHDAPGETFLGRARRLGMQLVTDLAHGRHSGVETIREFNRHHGTSRHAAMPVVFASVIGNGASDGIFLERLGWERLGGQIHTPQVCLDHQVFDARDRLTANWDCVEEAFAPGVLDAMVDAYRRLLGRLCAEPGAWDERRFDLTPAAQLDVRAAVNDTARMFAPGTLHGGVLAQARRTPAAPAVLTSRETLTYAQLAERATAVAASLAARGCGPGDRVLVHAGRGPAQIAAALGTLVAGCVYVPLNPRWPDARLRQIAGTAVPSAVLTDRRPAEVAAWAGALTTLPVEGDHPAGPFRAPRTDPESVAYVIFTSGTTGRPKGVVIRHEAALNTIADLEERFALGPRDRMLAISESTFDLSIHDIFGPLRVGGAVVVPDERQAGDIARLHELAAGHAVTVWNSVPAYLTMLADYRRVTARPGLPALRLAMASGDWVPVTLAAALRETLPGLRVVALGGATEASIWSNWYDVPEALPPGWPSVPYGHPLANQRFRVLDAAGADRPDWVPGDLFIGGHGLADGYLHAPGLTAAAFRTDPRTGDRLYRTGDRARYRPGGTLEFLGRADDQVKVNGFRVELSEVDAALLAHPGVRAAAAVLRRDDRGGTLTGHVVPGPGAGPGLERDLLAALPRRLPDYMVPGAIRLHDSLPLTANGKVDRARLSALPAQEEPGTAQEPASDVERRMLELWRQAVAVRGVTDDFFAYGGHSLAAAALMNAVEREFGVRLPLAALYEHRTVRRLATLLGRQAAHGPVRVRMGGRGSPVVLVHPVGGDILCYQPLVAALGDHATLWGIAASTHPDGERTVPALAREYADLADGDTVRLAGWSFGAVVAYEMARVLVDRGRRCDLVMIDPWLPATPGADVDDATLLASFVHNLSEGRLRGHAAGGDLESLVAGEPRLAGMSVPALTEMFGRYRANARALNRYEFTADARLRPVVLTATEGLGAGGAAYLTPLSASRYAAALPGATWHEVNGDHFSVVDPVRTPSLTALLLAGLPG